jgi:hypothetical protein
MATVVFALLGWIGLALGLSWLYFRRYTLSRSPAGVFDLRDVGIMIVGVVLVPFLYLILPLWVVSGLLILSTISVLYVAGEPILRTPPAIWLPILLVVGTDLGAVSFLGAGSAGFLAVNDLVLLMVIVGLTNLWAQSGMKARDITILAGLLAVYDVIATTLLPVTGDMLHRLIALPLAPQIAWGVPDSSAYGSIGLGDLLIAATFPLVMRKAFGRLAGISAMAIGCITIGSLLLLLWEAATPTIFPVMVVLGPVMISQYCYWVRRVGPERTTWQYLQAEPLRV